MSPKLTIPLLACTVLVGLIAGAMLVRQTIGPMDPSRLHQMQRKFPDPVKKQASHASGVHKARVMVASRAAIRSTEEQYTVSGVVDQLFRPYPKYHFQREEMSSLARSALEGEASNASITDAVGGYLNDWEDVDAHLWGSDADGEDGNVEIISILTVKLPLLLLCIGWIVFVELTAVMQRRGRDLALALTNGRMPENKLRAQMAKESQWMLLRPFATFAGTFCVFLVLKSSIDVFDKCFWNWDCWSDLDCNLRILTPAVAECTLDVVVPAMLLTGVIFFFLMAMLWSCTRPWAAIYMFCMASAGLFSIVLTSLFALLLWVVAAIGLSYFYFYVLPTLPDTPSWAQDLGSFSVSSDPSDGDFREGDAQQKRAPTDESPLDPLPSELDAMNFVERALYHIGDFWAQNFRYARMVWNGLFLRLFMVLVFGRRVHIHGDENVEKVASHDTVLLCCSGSSRYDLWLTTVNGLWPSSGASFLTFFPTLSSVSYTDPLGALSNFFFCGMGHFPPVLESDGEQTKKWNDYVNRRVLFELRTPSCIVGFKVDDTTSDDLGEIALGATQTHVIPAVITGMSDDIMGELVKCFSWDAGHNYPIHVVFGPPVQIATIRKKSEGASDMRPFKESSMKLIRESIDKVREEKEEKDNRESSTLYQASTNV